MSRGRKVWFLHNKLVSGGDKMRAREEIELIFLLLSTASWDWKWKKGKGGSRSNLWITRLQTEKSIWMGKFLPLSYFCSTAICYSVTVILKSVQSLFISFCYFLIHIYIKRHIFYIRRFSVYLTLPLSTQCQYASHFQVMVLMRSSMQCVVIYYYTDAESDWVVIIM